MGICASGYMREFFLLLIFARGTQSADEGNEGEKRGCVLRDAPHPAALIYRGG